MPSYTQVCSRPSGILEDGHTSRLVVIPGGGVRQPGDRCLQSPHPAVRIRAIPIDFRRVVFNRRHFVRSGDAVPRTIPGERLDLLSRAIGPGRTRNPVVICVVITRLDSSGVLRPDEITNGIVSPQSRGPIRTSLGDHAPQFVITHEPGIPVRIDFPRQVAATIVGELTFVSEGIGLDEHSSVGVERERRRVTVAVLDTGDISRCVVAELLIASRRQRSQDYSPRPIVSEGGSVDSSHQGLYLKRCFVVAPLGQHTDRPTLVAFQLRQRLVA